MQSQPQVGYQFFCAIDYMVTTISRHRVLAYVTNRTNSGIIG